MITLASCSKTAPIVNTVKYDSFCDGKYTPSRLTKDDIKNISEMRKTRFKPTIDKFIDYTALNEKEFKLCQK